MSALWLVFGCLGLGVLVARLGDPPSGLAQALNWWVMNVALPALILQIIPQVHFDRSYWFLLVANWWVFVGAWLVCGLLGRSLGWSRQRIGALVLVAGLGNTAFIGYPMIEAMRGRDGLALAVVGDQAGCFIALALGAPVVVAVYCGHSLDMRSVLKRVAVFPPFLALLVGVAIGISGGWSGLMGSAGPQLADLLGRVAATVIPLALFSVGLQLRPHRALSEVPPMLLALGWKMVLVPAMVAALAWVSGVHGLVRVVGVLQAAMPPMISAAIIAERSGLDGELANTVLGLGIVLSLLTIPWINSML